MSDELDPSKPAPNPEIPDLLRALRKEWTGFIGETDFTRRRGRARVLIASLEALCEEPEFVPPPLKSGPGTGARFWFDPKLDAGALGVELLPESPFDQGGESEGVFFLFTSRVARVCTRQPVDPYHVPTAQGVYFSYCLEKRYATPAPTGVRLPGSVIDGLASQLPRGGSAAHLQHFLLLDPRGTDDDNPPARIHVGTYEKLPVAIRAANRLAGKLQVRFLVATARIVFNGH